mmetsp:Transcript_16996/g.45842  ORF Transcript_16996/g.45842 Transcript_16996/m.45842 type:complete len:292 (-) Transcript_16996:193-1068(-)
MRGEHRASLGEFLDGAHEAGPHPFGDLGGREVVHRDAAVAARIDGRDDGHHLAVLLKRLVCRIHGELLSAGLDFAERVQQVLALVLRDAVRSGNVVRSQAPLAALDGPDDGHHLAMLLQRRMRLVERDRARATRCRRLVQRLKDVLASILRHVHCHVGNLPFSEEAICVRVEHRDDAPHFAVLLQRFVRLVGRERRALRLAFLEYLPEVLALILRQMVRCILDLLSCEHTVPCPVEERDSLAAVVVLAQLLRGFVQGEEGALRLGLGQGVEEVLLLVLREVGCLEHLHGCE